MEAGATNGVSGSGKPEGGGEASRPVVRCILWHARGATLPGPLIAALDRPAIQWKAWDCDLLSLAELFRRDAAPDQLTSDARAKVVLLVDPSRLQGLASVLDTIERYRARTPIWVFEGGASPKLSGASLADVRRTFVPDASDSPELPASVVVPSPPPPLRVVTRSIGPIVPRVIPQLGAKPVPRRFEDAMLPKPASGPAPGQAARADQHQDPNPPSLRLAGDRPTTAPNPTGIPIAARREQDEPDPADISQDRPASTLLTEEEIEMLLSDPPPANGGPAKRGRNVR